MTLFLVMFCLVCRGFFVHLYALGLGRVTISSLSVPGIKGFVGRISQASASCQSASSTRRFSCLLFYSLLYIYIFCDQVTRMGLFFGFITMTTLFLLCIGTYLDVTLVYKLRALTEWRPVLQSLEVMYCANTELINIPTVLPT